MEINAPCTAAALAILPIPRRRTPSLSDEIGCSPSFGYRYFDPLNLGSDENFPYFREAELKHGRVAMFATLGMALPDAFRYRLVHHGGDVFLSPSHNLRFDDVPSGLGALRAVPWEGWAQIVAALSFLELFVFRQRDPRDMPGDYGVGYFGLRDKGRHER